MAHMPSGQPVTPETQVLSRQVRVGFMINTATLKEGFLGAL
jgi:hypothetical protein